MVSCVSDSDHAKQVDRDIPGIRELAVLRAALAENANERSVKAKNLKNATRESSHRAPQIYHIAPDIRETVEPR